MSPREANDNTVNGIKVASDHSSDEDNSSETEKLLKGTDAASAKECQYAKLSVRIYEADGLPKPDAGILAQVKKRCPVEACRLLDPYVQVFFAGLKGSTTKQRRTFSPSWNQQVVFTCPFPLPIEPLVLQVRDDDIVAGGVVGTTLVHLDDISNPRDNGFLPVFGPCYVYLHDTKSLRSDDLEDVSYRGRLLMAIVTETTSETILTKPHVYVETTPALVEGSYGLEDEFLLFTCLQEASMINSRVAGKGDIRFTLQMGAIGRRQIENGVDSYWTTPVVLPVPINRDCMQIPYEDKMPCLWLKAKWPDTRKRMYASNILHKMAQKLKDTLKCIHMPENTIISQDEEKNVVFFKNLETTAKIYLKILKECFDSYAAKTQLDSERLKICQSDIEDIVKVSITAREAKDKTMLNSSLNKLSHLKQKMKILVNDPQCTLPDVMLWLECRGKRVGYAKIPARRLLYAKREHERGVHSATTADFFLRPIGKKDGISIVARVKCYFWLGLTKNINYCYENLPGGYTKSYSNDSVEETFIESIPRMLYCFEKHHLQLRAHLHQARSLPCLDLTRSPGCFARVFVMDRIQNTQVKEGTVNPIWDETLHFRGLVFYGDEQRAKDSPTTVVVEILDKNASWKSKLLGRAVITSIKVNDNFRNPPTLQWFDVQHGKGEANGQLLAAFELSRDDEEDSYTEEQTTDVYQGCILPIPPEIKPRFSMHRIEILFWGLRELKSYHWRHLHKPRIDLECAGEVVQSSTLLDYKRHSNFSSTVAHLDMDLPDEEGYLPTIVLKLMDTGSFGRQRVVATHALHSLHKYAFQPRAEATDSKERFSRIHLAGYGDSMLIDARPSFVRSRDVIINMESTGMESSSTSIAVAFPWTRGYRKSIIVDADENEEEDEELDWWSRYYISTNQWPSLLFNETGNQMSRTSLPSLVPSRMTVQGITPVPRSSLPRASKVGLRAFRDVAASMDIRRERQAKETAAPRHQMGFVVYPCELESVPEFNGFQEWLHSFELTRGKKFKRNAPREKVVAIFKGCFRIYRTPLPPSAADDLLPHPEGHEGLFGGLPNNTPTRVLVRAYIVKAIDLTPTDVTNTTDPYIVMKLGSKRLSDKENYISKQLNPVFGKCFEFVATFPADAILRIQVYDWDLLGSDDLVGETVVDIENRFYSRHRPGCGIGRVYETSGPNAWRDALKPTEILRKLCQDDRLDGPYMMANQRIIRIGQARFEFQEDFGNGDTGAENMALALLHRWSEISPGKYGLTPEHIETRTLYHRKKPGEAQGQLVMWLDMFEENTVPPNPPRDISVRKPESFELRVIIWNTDDVLLSDVAFLTGERMSDIYVKGWLTGKEDAQTTDVHYRSLTGEGNFNWRFVFPFDYLRTERRILVSRKVSVFSWDETEFKLLPHLTLEVWDADHFKSDDNLGTLTLDLNHFPRGAKTSKHCTLDLLKKDGDVPHMSIFKQTRVRGWWPFFQKKEDGQMELTGKVEAEIELLTKKEAEKNPAGLARQEPEALPKPKRPETSFINILHPLKTLRYAFWRNYKGKIIKIVAFIALAMILVLFFYSVPGYTAKKILGA